MEHHHHPEPTGVSRRSFLKAAGFSAAALAAAGCSRSPGGRAIALLSGAEDQVPGRAAYYATLCSGCEAGCGVLGKVVDGRPIKLEGNPDHPLSKGGLCAIGQAQVLSLYDSKRLAAPLHGGKAIDLAAADRTVLAGLAAARDAGLKVRVLSRTVTSPSLRAEIAALLAGFADGALVEVDPDSTSALLEGMERVYGRAVLPRYRLDRAQAILAVEADFLGAWISPVEHAAGFAAARDLSRTGKPFAHLAVLEGRYTLTGGKADERIRIAPAQAAGALAQIAAAATGGAAEGPLPAAVANRVADRLAKAPRGTALVLCGSDDPAAQAWAAWLNHALGADGENGPVDLVRPSRIRRGRDAALLALVAEMKAGEVGALVLLGGNPVAELPDAAGFAAALAKVPLVVATSHHRDETAAVAHVVVPDLHPFETWTDAEPAAGVFTLGQPLLRPLPSGRRAALESVAAWRGQPRGAREIVAACWRTEIFPASGAADFTAFFDRAVHDGFAERKPPAGPALGRATRPAAPAAVAATGLVAAIHSDLRIGDGRHSENAWLMELPDPLSKTTWENVAALSAATAARLSVKDGDVIRVEAGGAAIELPAVIQPGQHDEVVSIPRGFGRIGTERFTTIGQDWLEGEPTVPEGGRAGARAEVLLAVRDGRISATPSVTVKRTGRRVELARTQTYDSEEVPSHLAPPDAGTRDVAREQSLAAFAAGRPAEHGHAQGPLPDLWNRAAPTGPQWGMTVDLAACTGCSACVIACQAENNIPVVGRDEVRRMRDMQWIRVDRYYTRRGAEADLAFQPMMCHHCGNAPCETVCPVLATVHSEDGLNQQVYNRCVGTRYCANNCPYKVRRFNWFDYPREDPTENLVLNPDVTVRSRGVMEKCSFCVQRIRDVKANARSDGRMPDPSAVQPACAQSCPTRAITFGDRTATGGALAERRGDPRYYEVLAELNVRPAVGYLAAVRHREERVGGEHD